MRLLIAAIGRWKHSPEKELWEQYRARLPWELTLKELAPAAAAHPAEQRTRETEALLAAARSFHAHRLVWLDETGASLTSPALAERIGRWRDGGDRNIAFLIGGDHGLDKARLKEGDLALSLGALTWPHLLVRPLLAEQLYRAHAILSGHPYHRV